MFLTKALVIIALLFAGTKAPGQQQTGKNRVDAENILFPGENIYDKIKQNLFVKVQLSKARCYMGEPLLVTYKLYSRLVSTSKIISHPTLSGFSVYDMISPVAPVKSIEKINGKWYQVYTLRKAQIIPLHAGNITVDPIEINNNIHFIKTTRSSEATSNLGELLDDLEDEEKAPAVDKDYTAKSQSLHVEVLPLPDEGVAPGFNGAVGNYNIEAVIASTNIKVRDAVELKVTVKGDGNVPLIDAPEIRWPAGIDTLDIRATEKIDPSVIPLRGAKTFIYRFIPERPGRFEIPPVSFTFFHPVARSYRTVQTIANSFQVANVKTIARRPDSTEIKAARPAATEARFFQAERWGWLMIIILLFGGCAWLWRNNARLKARNKENLLLIESLKAAITANPSSPAEAVTDVLGPARILLDSHDLQGFYRELNQALWKILAEKTQLPPSGLNKDSVRVSLNQMCLDQKMITRVENTLLQCETNLYSPEHRQSDAAQLMASAEMIVAGLQKTNQTGAT